MEKHKLQYIADRQADLFILDEPEAAISPMRMLRLMADIYDLAG